MTGTGSGLRSFSDPAWFPDVSSDISFYTRPDDTGLAPSVDRACRKIKAVDGNPGPVLELQDVFFIPGPRCLYDSRGRRIAESCIRRGEGLVTYVSAGAEEVKIPDKYSRVSEPLLYLAALQGHWGHFLTESISRLWARSVYPELRKLKCFFGESDNDNCQKIFAYLNRLGIFGRNIFNAPTPVKIDRCFVPLASFANNAEAYSAHALSPREVAASYLNENRIEVSAQPVYLSRGGADSLRVIRGEAELEPRLEEKGVRIVHPESLSLGEQITLFNKHKVFIGCWGSAFHNILFSLQPREIVTHVICEDIPHSNFLMLDAIQGNKANYVRSAHMTPATRQEWPVIDLSIDVETTLTYLAERGCI